MVQEQNTKKDNKVIYVPYVQRHLFIVKTK